MSGIHVGHLTLSHFRSHRLGRMALDGRPVALFGPNGAGKTNILEAVSLLSPGRGLRRAGAEEMARRPERLGWKIRATLADGARIHEVETGAEPGQPRISPASSGWCPRRTGFGSRGPRGGGASSTGSR